MFNLLVLFTVVSPLIGIWELEHGAFSVTYGRNGSPNGATLAFAVYAIVLYGTFLLARRPPRQIKILYTESDRRFHEQGTVILLVLLALVFLIVVGAGGINVLNTTVGKGEFRANLGGLGAILYLGLKWVVPALLSYIILTFKYTNKSGLNRVILFAILAVAVLFGASWGFKSAAITILLPTAIVMLPRPTWRQVAALLVGGVTMLSGFALWFNAGASQTWGILNFLWMRVTTIQGDVPWGIWGMYQRNYSFPDYWPTLVAGFGDRFLSLFGITQDNFDVWMAYHFGIQLTWLTGAGVREITAGHSVTGTPFVEGIIAGGMVGAMAFAVIAGLVAAMSERFMLNALERGDFVVASVSATYCFVVIVWLNSSGIVQIYHISTIFGIGLCYLTLTGIQGLWFSARQPALQWRVTSSPPPHGTS